jgi:hypothetical protein
MVLAELPFAFETRDLDGEAYDLSGQPLDTANTNIVAWMARVGERPSAKA